MINELSLPHVSLWHGKFTTVHVMYTLWNAKQQPLQNRRKTFTAAG